MQKCLFDRLTSWLCGCAESTDSAVGDYKGLYPIAYLQRAIHKGTTSGGQDMDIAWLTANHYILGWPHRLADGTFSRTTGGDWPGEKSTAVGSFVWGDDQTMGTVLVARMSSRFKVPIVQPSPHGATLIELKEWMGGLCARAHRFQSLLKR